MSSIDGYKSLNLDGKGSELLKISIVNTILSIITFGIYYFWAKVRVKKFFHANTELLGGRFDYHVTGKEKFIAFIKASLIMSGVFGIIGGIPYFLSYFNISPLISQIAGVIFFYLLIGLAAPLLTVASRRFTLSRTSWNNIHFKFAGHVKPLYKIMSKGILLSICTLGFYIPWYICELRKFTHENSKLGKIPFKYTGEGREIIKYFLIFIIILLAYSSYLIFSVFPVIKTNLMEAQQNQTHIALEGEAGFTLLLPLLFILYYIWLYIKLYKYHWENTAFQKYHFRCNITVSKFILNFIKAVLTAVLTAGIGLPWSVIIMKRYLLGTIHISENTDVAAILAAPDEESSALAEAIDEAGDAFDAIADFLG
ncbi:MAG: YjgN family protein [Spirochaetia bacterium]|nr:YjgN family protein [Spirochaetia bacterium]